jgi:hypothetical protein
MKNHSIQYGCESGNTIIHIIFLVPKYHIKTEDNFTTRQNITLHTVLAFSMMNVTMYWPSMLWSHDAKIVSGTRSNIRVRNGPGFEPQRRLGVHCNHNPHNPLHWSVLVSRYCGSIMERLRNLMLHKATTWDTLDHKCFCCYKLSKILYNPEPNI